MHVIDDDARDRMRICRVLSSDTIHTEPFETVREFLDFSPTSGLVLCAGKGGNIADLVEGLDRGCWLPAMAYSTNPEVVEVVRAMQVGIASYFASPFTVDDFLREYQWLKRSLAAQIEDRSRAADARKRIEKLSDREREILDCMLDHSSSKEIARHLGISPRTVEAHRASLMSRLGVRTATQAIRVALEGGLSTRSRQADATWSIQHGSKDDADEEELAFLAGDNRQAQFLQGG